MKNLSKENFVNVLEGYMFYLEETPQDIWAEAEQDEAEYNRRLELYEERFAEYSEILKSNHILEAIEYIYSEVLPGYDDNWYYAAIHDFKVGTLKIGKCNDEFEVMTYMEDNGDFYAYNLTHNHPEDGEQFETEMGWR